MKKQLSIVTDETPTGQADPIIEVQAGFIGEEPTTETKSRKKPEFYTFSPVDLVLLTQALDGYMKAQQDASAQLAGLGNPAFNQMIEASRQTYEEASRIKELIRDARLVRLSF